LKSLKFSLGGILILIALVACHREFFTLKWTIPAGEGLCYQILLTEYDSVETVKKKKNKLFERNEDQSEPSDSIREPIKRYAVLKEKDNWHFNAKIIPNIADNRPDVQKHRLNGYLFKIVEGVSIDADVDHTGIVNSIDVSERQENLLALLFQIPDKPVKIREKWPIHIALLDEGIAGENSNVNEENFARIIQVRQNGNRKIAVLEYKIYHTVSGIYTNPLTGKLEKGQFAIGFKGKSEFDITAGRLRQFKGVLYASQYGSFVQESKIFIKVSKLKQMPVSLISFIDERYDKNYYTSIINEMDRERKVTLKKAIETKKKKRTFREFPEHKGIFRNMGPPDCPVKYSVQILGSKEQIPLDSEQFSGINFPIKEHQRPSEEYMYTYRVGKECSLRRAELILEQMLELGFNTSFIVKEAEQ
jgi:hypothetical protein